MTKLSDLNFWEVLVVSAAVLHAVFLFGFALGYTWALRKREQDNLDRQWGRQK